jgi:hypothetical protein
MAFRLDLTNEQMETLRYALNLAHASCVEDMMAYRRGCYPPRYEAMKRDQARSIIALQAHLDTATQPRSPAPTEEQWQTFLHEINGTTPPKED